MRDGWNAWKEALGLIWRNLLQVMIVNVLWTLTSALVVTLGPATLAAYWWNARVLRDEREPQSYPLFFKALVRLAVKGLVWSLGWVVVLYLAYISLMVWPQLLPPVGVAIAQFAWGYGLLYLLMMQPYLLEALAVDEEPWAPALKRSAWQVLANPLYSHMHLVIPVVGLAIAYNYNTPMLIVLAGALLLFMAVVADKTPWKYGEPPPRKQGRIEDVL